MAFDAGACAGGWCSGLGASLDLDAGVQGDVGSGDANLHGREWLGHVVGWDLAVAPCGGAVA